MARILIIYFRSPRTKWLLTYLHSLHSFRRYSANECFYLNASRPIAPRYLRSLQPDLVVFHHTFLLPREVSDFWPVLLHRVEFVKSLHCPKVLLNQDEQVRMDLATAFIRDLDISTVFSPSEPSNWRLMYEGVDFESVAFHRMLNAYVDERLARRIARRSRRLDRRPVDVGYRTWYTQPFYGSHGQLKQLIGRVFLERAQEFGLSTDISMEARDALWGNRWMDFLLKCKYTLGVEGGTSVFDWDGEIARLTAEYVRTHPSATYEEIEAACFPGLDGAFRNFTLSSRNLEAATTRTCQVLVEGEYAGVLKPWSHYIPLRRDFSNLEEVLSLMKQDQLRASIVERTYADIVASGGYTYRTLAELVLGETLHGATGSSRTARSRFWVSWNRLDEHLWQLLGDMPAAAKRCMRRWASILLGENRVKGVMAYARKIVHRL